MEIFFAVLKGALIVIGGLSILVIIHELGHFIPAKLFGMRVEKFYLFFDWPKKLWSFNYKGTEYGIGLLPLGGYVKISGIIDESFDKEHLEKTPEPWEYRSKPVWQRIIVMVGGVTMNVILGILIFSFIKFYFGEKKIPISEVRHGIYIPEGSIAEEIDLKNGDKIKKYKGEDVEYFNDIASPMILVDEDAYFDIEREGDLKKVDIPSDLLEKFSDKKEKQPELFRYRFLSIIGNMDGKGVKQYKYTNGDNVKRGDRIISINETEINYFDELKTELKKHKNQEVKISTLRGADTLQFFATLDSSALLGIPIEDEIKEKEESIRYGFAESMVSGTKAAFGVVIDNVKGFKKIFSGDLSASKGVEGPVGIAKTWYQVVESSGLFGFLAFTGVISMALAFMNILPIPALDGGHLVLLLYEGITRRKPSTKVVLVFQQIGMIILLSLIVFVIFNDIMKL